jgi:Zn-finger nucleic acid-binding protein
MDPSACPRDGGRLSAGTGALGEDICGACQGRLLDAAAARRLFVEIMGIPEHVLFELAREGAQRIACPLCGTRMTECWARGVLVDLCRGCGAGWLDGGELTRLARDLIEEVRVQAEQSERAPARPAVRFEVLCVNCDMPLDLTKTNWLINTRPWCPPCAAPYAGVLANAGGSLISALFNFFSDMLFFSRWHRRGVVAPGSWHKSPDVLRIAPSDADKYFGAFYRFAR